MMKSGFEYWTLIGQTAAPCGVEDWAAMFGDMARRRVALTRIGPFEVSTVFLGLNHNFSRRGAPLLFETMTFGGGGFDMEGMNDCDGRWSTWAEAEAGHRRAVAYLKAQYCAPGEEPVEVEAEA